MSRSEQGVERAWAGTVETPGRRVLIDAERLKASWARVMTHGDQVALRFYSRLFTLAPEVRDLFPISMTVQRDRFVTALGRTVVNVDRIDRLRPYLEQLGRDHRRYGVIVDHYQPVGEALFTTLSDFLGHDWTPDLADDWENAYRLVATVMAGAAQQADAMTPAWWDAELVAHERRTFDIAVLTVKPAQPYPYRPGQSMSVEVASRPRARRYYSPANAPRRDGGIDLHVRRVPGGKLSSALVDEVDKGDVVRLGPPVGNRLVLPDEEQGDLLLVAGGTGLAPLKALTEQVATREHDGHPPRKVTLVVGARSIREFYDVDDLLALEEQLPGLDVILAVEQEHARGAMAALLPPRARVGLGTAAEVVMQYGPWVGRRSFVCGSDDMVASTVRSLWEAGHQAELIHYEGFEGLGGDMHGVVDAGGRYQQ